MGVVNEKSDSGACADILADDGGNNGVANTEAQAGKNPGHCRGEINVPDDVVSAGTQDAGVLEQHRVDVFESLVGIEEDDKEHQGHDNDHLGEETKPKPQDNEGGKRDTGQGIQHADEGLKHGIDLAIGSKEKTKYQPEQHSGDETNGGFGQSDPQVLKKNTLVKPDGDVFGDTHGGTNVKRIERLGANGHLPCRQKEGDKADLHEEHCPVKASLHCVPPSNAARVRAQFRGTLFARKARRDRGDVAMDCYAHFSLWRA